MEKIKNSVLSGIPVLFLETGEYERNIQDLEKMGRELDLRVLSWNSTKGISGIQNGKDLLFPNSLFPVILDLRNSLIILEDLPLFWKQGDPTVISGVKEIARKFPSQESTCVILSPSADSIPAELKDYMEVHPIELPNFQSRKTKIGKILSNYQITEQDLNLLSGSSAGMSEKQIQETIQKAIFHTQEMGDRYQDDCSVELPEILNLLLLDMRKDLLRGNNSLTLYSPEDLPEVGGLGRAKDWIRKRKKLFFSPKARSRNLPCPKGLILTGIPGTGKSLLSKTLAKEWEIPLIMLDFGSLFGSLLGQSEGNLKQALKIVDSLAPCICNIEEIEKSLSGSQGDGGTSSRIFGMFLTWLQEHKSQVFVVATSNNLDLLPPEFSRKGRWDEVFFVDLPSLEERKEIWLIHSSRKKIPLTDSEMTLLSEESSGFSGAEIEQILTDSLIEAFNQDEDSFPSFSEIRNQMYRTVPLSVSQRETVERYGKMLREGRVTNAS